MKYSIVGIILLSTTTLHAEVPVTCSGVYREAIAVSQKVCGDDLGCRTLIETIEAEEEQEYKNKSLPALTLYILQTLRPKLPDSEDTRKHLARIEEIFKICMKSSD